MYYVYDNIKSEIYKNNTNFLSSGSDSLKTIKVIEKLLT